MIVKLAPNVANQIAAGEVIERPSSVVKELVENSMDAGAENIEVEIIGAGRELIRVRDDGDGIEGEDFPLVFQRSATSKIRTVEDIYRLISLGFRGEALASIASVSRCELSSARRGELLGKKLSIAGGASSEIQEIPFKQGTELKVMDLFYNTPVRYKFLKSDASEKSRIIKIVAMLALSHPEIGLRLIIDGSEIFHLRQNSTLKDRVQDLYGREIAKALIPIHAEANEIEISGYIAGPEYSLGNRSQQFFIINGRVAEADVLKRALNEAYDGLLMKHRHQAYAVVLRLPPQMVDVNVHPQKLEVKFDREDILYSLLYNAARNALISDRTERGSQREDYLYSEEEAIQTVLAQEPGVEETERAEPRANEDRIHEALTHEPSKLVSPTMATLTRETEVLEKSASEVRVTESMAAGTPEHEEPKFGAAEAPRAEEDSYEKRYLKQLIERMEAKRKDEEQEPYAQKEKKFILDSETRVELEDRGSYQELIETDLEEVSMDEPSFNKAEVRPYLSVDFRSMRIVGQALKTFIILEKGDRLYLVDQHAAHERVLFERFYREFRQGKIVSQMLLSPYEIAIPTGEEASYGEALDYFSSIGIEAEIEGDKVLIKALPVFGEIISMEDMRQIIESYLEHGKRAYNKNFIDAIIMRSCKAAIKAGDELNEIQMRDLLDMLSACENPKTCPHGRPVVIELERRFFDRLFKRIV